MAKVNPSAAYSLFQLFNLFVHLPAYFYSVGIGLFVYQ